MSLTLLISSIVIFILSLVIGIILAMTYNKIEKYFFTYSAILHFTFFIIAILSVSLFKDSLMHHYTTLFTCCSGIMLSGLAIRKETLNRILRSYFSVYILFAVIFFYSPSRLFYFISGSFSQYEDSQEFRLKDNYYLVEQQSMLHLSSRLPSYKIIRKFGIYNRTISRDINFEEKLMNVKLVRLNNDTIILEGKTSGNIHKIIGIKPGFTAGIIVQKHN